LSATDRIAADPWRRSPTAASTASATTTMIAFPGRGDWAHDAALILRIVRTPGGAAQ
jgi:hypothetical protein